MGQGWRLPWLRHQEHIFNACNDHVGDKLCINTLNSIEERLFGICITDDHGSLQKEWGWMVVIIVILDKDEDVVDEDQVGTDC